ncbi:ribosomal protein L22 [Hamiltosporidium tvaerminnensis]|uniref:Ribosomal protein L22 n=3 Tax=Hamiltosporidium TaxID=1176354 RepID=A0A4Q9KTB2_9MICR|nr:60S ribosomal protein L17B [Hamiltosporidium tvaerminnensis]TBT97199.1 ribosomal protein L22 [Hamiltosporidium magnivora]TBU19982.1 ribosomal protein L22 [Hamiltosporidium tvaerminnensis]
MKNKYSVKIANFDGVKACVNKAKVSFKNTRETSRPLLKKSLEDALKYLADVENFKKCVPFTRFNGGIQCTSQAKGLCKPNKGRWPLKSVKLFKGLIDNLVENAKAKSMDPKVLVITHVQVNKAPKVHGRMHRAHGRVSPYNKSPCHVEIIATKQKVDVPLEDEDLKVEELQE